MASLDVAFIKEQGVNFAVVSVKDHVVQYRTTASRAISRYECDFGVPTVLVGSHNHQFIGRRDLVNFCASVGTRRLPWKRYQIS